MATGDWPLAIGDWRRALALASGDWQLAQALALAIGGWQLALALALAIGDWRLATGDQRSTLATGDRQLHVDTDLRVPRPARGRPLTLNSLHEEYLFAGSTITR